MWKVLGIWHALEDIHSSFMSDLRKWIQHKVISNKVSIFKICGPDKSKMIWIHYKSQYLFMIYSSVWFMKPKTYKLTNSSNLNAQDAHFEVKLFGNGEGQN